MTFIIIIIIIITMVAIMINEKILSHTHCSASSTQHTFTPYNQESRIIKSDQKTAHYS